LIVDLNTVSVSIDDFSFGVIKAIAFRKYEKHLIFHTIPAIAKTKDPVEFFANNVS